MKDPLLIHESSPSTYKSRYKKVIKQRYTTVYTTEYRSKRNQTVKPWWA